MPDTPAVQFIGVSKAFGPLTVLDDLTFEVPRGQKLAIIGPSGSGKTTLLRLLMTLERPDQGEIQVSGEILAVPPTGDGRRLRGGDIRKVRGKIGMVFQHFNLFPHLTALENVSEAPIHVLRIAREDAELRGMTLLEKVGLAGKSSSYPRQLSGGQQQRVAIARALAMQPEVMLFDEITSALDPELVREVLQVVRALAHEQGGMTMLIVTHEIGFARDIADRVIFMEHGRIVEEGPPPVMFRQPANARTREFLQAILEP